MFQTLKSWLTASRPVKSTPNPRRFAPQVESLHDRITPSVYLTGGHIIIYGTSINDTASVTQVGGVYRVWEDNNGYGVQPKVTDFPVAAVTGQISFQGYDGNDTFTNGTALPSFAHGGNGIDVFIGGSGQDSFYGDAGGDALNGGRGSDTLYGGDGNDWMYAGDDSTSDHNTLDGGSGNDTLTGGTGVDNLFGQDGNDLMDDGLNNFSFNFMDGGNGNDTLKGGEGTDRLHGGSGNDFIHGNGGGDHLFGDDGSDRLFGDAGNDLLDGGVGDGEHDDLVGGAGRDEFAYDMHHDSSWLPGYHPGYNHDRPIDYDPTEDVNMFPY